MQDRRVEWPDGARTCTATGAGVDSELAVSASGETLYCSTRTDGAIVTFSVDASTGALTKRQSVGCGGVCPRMFILDYSGAKPCLRVGNQARARPCPPPRPLSLHCLSPGFSIRKAYILPGFIPLWNAA